MSMCQGLVPAGDFVPNAAASKVSISSESDREQGSSEVTMHQNRESNSHQTEIQREINKFRQILPQALVTGASSLLFLSMGMLTGYPALIISDLTGRNEAGQLHFSTDEASWYGALTYIFEPVGSIMVGSFLQPVGCKKLMILTNIPVIGYWMMVYYANSNFIIYVTNALAGAEAEKNDAEKPQMWRVLQLPATFIHGPQFYPTKEDISETVEGVLVAYFLGSLFDWRQVALLSATVPIICAILLLQVFTSAKRKFNKMAACMVLMSESMPTVGVILLLQIPETPMWLMSKGQPEAALKSLQWLRGWATPELVKDEFQKLEFYRKRTVLTVLHGYAREVDTRDEVHHSELVKGSDCNGVSIGDPCETTMKIGASSIVVQVEERDKRSLSEMWRDLTRRDMLIPVIKCFGLCALYSFGGVPPLQPYLVQVFQEMNIPEQANWATVWVALVGIFGNVVFMVLIRQVRKKPLLIFSLASSALCLILLAIFSMHDKTTLAKEFWFCQWWPLILFILLFFCHNVGLHPITFIYIGEILPYRGRGIATGVAVSFFYITMFVTVKLFATTEQQLGLHGIFLIFAAFSIVGIFFTHFYLPETEGRFLSDIETDIAQNVQNTSAVDGPRGS